jgi:hypothetical protein
MRRAHGATQLLHFAHHELARQLVWPPPVIGQARRRQTPLIADIGVEVDRLVGIGQVFGLGDHGRLLRVIGREVVAIGGTPAWYPGRRWVEGGGADRTALHADRADRNLRAADETDTAVVEIVALKSSIVCFCALGPMKTLT